MLRSLLAFLLLANYLLVVGAGLVASRPEVPRFSAAHPYVHSLDCQQHNYLRLDCFERCNGEQAAAKMKWPDGTGLHFLAQLKGLDAHCALGEALAGGERAPGAYPARVAVGGPGTEAAGFERLDYPPPCWK
ncbi:hypothetical protein [Hymenobacter sp. PAMC 26628]|uniref:hypothetical protein n=1 Tax=Hymenobacter sp. PAMC 26628 TaxID=1484118 RepID=UPI0007705B07|nr:hypothetical protein [Hymenobacter sp. PAMC 26628]AMJ66213.1 hypothetical protein AXW84_12775 [Hymenobacter sp. PAMC 26628]